MAWDIPLGPLVGRADLSALRRMGTYGGWKKQFEAEQPGGYLATEEVSVIVSVIMAAYNAEAYVSEAVESILTQTLTDLELIVVDDGSPDATWERILACAQNNARVRSIAEEHRGFGAALNRGIA